MLLRMLDVGTAEGASVQCTFDVHISERVGLCRSLGMRALYCEYSQYSNQRNTT